MKLALPSRKDCKYIRRKLKIFWSANLNNSYTPENSQKELDRALIRLFSFFKLSTPKIIWIQSFALYEKEVLGKCSLDGSIEMLTPYYMAEQHNLGFKDWLDTLFHEIGHYVLWHDWEKKARDFASKLCKK